MSKLACSRGVAPTPRFGAVAAYLGTQQAPRSHSELPSGWSFNGVVVLCV